MPEFRYVAVSAGGELEEGRLEAADRAAAIAALQARGRLPLRAEPAGILSLGMILRRRSLPARETALLLRGLAGLVQAGIALDRALQMLADASRDPRARELVLKLHDAVREGTPLSEAMSRAGFGKLAVAMLRAAEAAGTLDAGLARLAAHEERSQALRERIVSALAYPALLAAVAAISLGILLVWVVPQFTELFRDAGRALPLSTQVVLAAAAVLRDGWWAIAAVLVVAVVAGRAFLATARADRLLLAVPIAGELVRRVQFARLCASLAALLSSGVPLAAAAAMAREGVGNRVLAEALDAGLEALRAGRSFAAPLRASGAFPVLGVQMIEVGENSARLVEMLARVAELYERETDAATTRLIAVLEPALVVGLGAGIGAVILSLVSAIVGLNDLPL
jgi:general secretion pathway protein F